MHQHFPAVVYQGSAPTSIVMCCPLLLSEEVAYILHKAALILRLCVLKEQFAVAADAQTADSLVNFNPQRGIISMNSTDRIKASRLNGEVQANQELAHAVISSTNVAQICFKGLCLLFPPYEFSRIICGRVNLILSQLRVDSRDAKIACG